MTRRRSTPDFEQVVKDHRAAVAAFARSLTGDVHLADDVVQETFIRAWRHLPGWRGDGPLEAWLVTICRNTAYSMMARRRVTEQLPDDRPDSSDDFERTDLLDLIARLDRDRREVAALCLVLSWTYAEAAEVLGIPVGTVRSRLSRARADLTAMTETTRTAGERRARGIA